MPKTASLRRRSSHATPRIRYTNTTAATTNPITEGIVAMPMIAIMIGTHSQTMAIAAPAISDALGTRPIRRRVGEEAVSAVTGLTSSSMNMTTPSTYGTQR